MENASLSEYQDALRGLLLCVMHQPALHRVNPRGAECRVLWALPQLVDIVAKEQSDLSADENGAIRTHICSRCEYQDANGYCPLRMSGECCVSREEGRVMTVIKRIIQH
jgi:hypothetical protein